MGISDDNYPVKNVFMERINKICKNPEFESRSVGDNDGKPMIILAFLPKNDIDKISKATKSLLEKYKVIPDYEIVIINSKACGSNAKKAIEDGRTKAINASKKGVLVLSGKQCSLGVSIDECDIVLLLNNSTSSDMIFQMMFRCMTEGKNKRNGFVVDLNIRRAIETTANYASLIKSKRNNFKSDVKYILQERLINLNGDHWNPSFGYNTMSFENIVDNIHKIYYSKSEEYADMILRGIKDKNILFSKNDQVISNTLFKFSKCSPQQREIIEKYLNDDSDSEIKIGIEKQEIETDEISENETPPEDENKDENVNFADILRPFIPFVCIFTIHDKETSFVEMCNLIDKDKYKCQMLLDQSRIWWGKKVDSSIIKLIIKIYKDYLNDNNRINEIVKIVKETFRRNINNQKELSILIDKFIIPQASEKKENAEVSTPLTLRKEMLDLIPSDFWTTPKRVLEPCCGKGGFNIDIIERFMIGLQNMYPNDHERYKTTVEECLYFGDINPTNIFINKLLIDSCNEYSLNYYCGDTLKVNLLEKWNIDGFDAVIGNPPYNSSGNTATGNTIWQLFTKKSLKEWVKKNGYLLFVHPPGWRKPNTERSKFYGLYNLMTIENQMIYLSIHGTKDGKKTFNCGTRYDYYLIQKKDNNNNEETIINDEVGEEITLQLQNYEWIPNYNIAIILKLIAKTDGEKISILHSESIYEGRKSWMSRTETVEFKYPVINTIPLTGIRYTYSNINDNGHFGVSKVIFGDNGLNDAIIDMDGKYGMTQNSMAIKVDNLIEAENIKKALLSLKFKNIMKSCVFSSFRIDWRLFTYFKKDFWKEFI